MWVAYPTHSHSTNRQVRRTHTRRAAVNGSQPKNLKVQRIGFGGRDHNQSKARGEITPHTDFQVRGPDTRRVIDDSLALCGSKCLSWARGAQSRARRGLNPVQPRPSRLEPEGIGKKTARRAVDGHLEPQSAKESSITRRVSGPRT